MGYAHINNLYKDQDVLLCKELWALEKVDGTSAHISYERIVPSDPDDSLIQHKLTYFAGGAKHEDFVKLFNHDELLEKFKGLELSYDKLTVYGEAYGGRLQGQSAKYGKELRFIAFDVLNNENWLSVPYAESICKSLGIEFVPYERISADIASIDKERDRDSEVAIRRGMGTGHIREGVILRPIEELRRNSGKRIIAKHKRDEFRETKTPREVDPTKALKLKEAQSIADEYVTATRLEHVLSKMPDDTNIEHTGKVIDAMLEDVHREADEGQEFTKEADKAIGRSTALLFKEHLKQKLRLIAA